MRGDLNRALNASVILICLSHDAGVINFRGLHLHWYLSKLQGESKSIRISLVNIKTTWFLHFPSHICTGWKKMMALLSQIEIKDLCMISDVISLQFFIYYFFFARVSAHCSLSIESLQRPFFDKRAMGSTELYGMSLHNWEALLTGEFMN